MLLLAAGMPAPATPPAPPRDPTLNNIPPQNFSNVPPKPPRREFDKIKRVPQVPNVTFTTDADENCEEFPLDDLPLATRLKELREKKV